MPPEQKEQYRKTLSTTRKAYLASLTKEEKKAQNMLGAQSRAKTRSGWSEEKKQEVSANQSKGLKKFWNNVSEDFLNEYCSVRSKSQKRHWDSLSPSQRKVKIDKCTAGLCKHWDEVSEEYRENYRQIHRDIWINMPEDQQIEHSKKTSIGTKKAFSAMSKDEYDAMCQKHVEAGKLRKGSIHVYREDPRDHKFVHAEQAKDLVEKHGYKYGNPSRRWKREDALAK